MNSSIAAFVGRSQIARSSDGPALLQKALAAAATLPRSAMRQSLLARMARSPEAVALHRLNALDAAVKDALEHGV